jgi:large subunit ribosomal protein L13
MIIDGSDAVLGRLSSMAAKKLLQGEEVIIVNAEKILITGDPHTTSNEFLRLRRIGNPKHGPFYPRIPDRIVRRTISGMIPKGKKGTAALKKLRVHIGNPENKKGEQVAVKQIKTSYITIGKLAKQLGWQGQ